MRSRSQRPSFRWFASNPSCPLCPSGSARLLIFPSSTSSAAATHDKLRERRDSPTICHPVRRSRSALCLDPASPRSRDQVDFNRRVEIAPISIRAQGVGQLGSPNRVSRLHSRRHLVFAEPRAIKQKSVGSRVAKICGRHFVLLASCGHASTTRHGGESKVAKNLAYNTIIY